MTAELPAKTDSLAAFIGRLPSTVADELRAAPLDSLAVPQLVERFALALAARRGRSPRVAEVSEPVQEAPPFAPPPTPAVLAAVPGDSAAPEGTRPFDMPASMRSPGMGNIDWFDTDEDEEEEAVLQSLHLPGQRQEPELASALDEGAADEQAIPHVPDEDSYSSLLAMKPHAPQFVRVDEDAAADIAEPVVIFPGQAQPAPPIVARLPGGGQGSAPVPTEAALREALAALQKMSGAA
jgi:hypothetical protein